MPLSLAQGTRAVAIARDALDVRLGVRLGSLGRTEESVFDELRGVFVTLNTLGPAEERLRGCIGFPYPVKPLGEAISLAAVEAATGDPRFPPVSRKELDEILVEVSILTVPAPLDCPSNARPSAIRVGKDGLIVSRGYLSGLLLPQVATEFGLGSEEFLAQACLKAGLPPDAWTDSETKVQVFQAEVFAEEEPRGMVARAEPRAG